MRRIAVINQKGGIGKTTITTNLGHALALMGHRVTVIDLDPQGQLAESYGIFRAPTRGIDQVLMIGTELRSVRIKVRDQLTLIPAGMKLGEVEELQEGGVKRAKLLKKAMNGNLAEQDYIIYDCPPSSGLLVANAIFEADEVLIPVAGDYLSLNSLAKMMLTLKRFEPFLHKPLKQWIVQSRFIPRRRLSKEVHNKLLHHFSDKMLATPIREAAVMAECPGAGRTIYEYRGSCRSAKEFTNLANDLIESRTA